MWNYNGEDDASRCLRKGPDNFAALATILADLYKGEKEDFTHLKCREGFSMYIPIDWVSFSIIGLTQPFSKVMLVELNPSTFNRNGERSLRGSIAPLRSQRTMFET